MGKNGSKLSKDEQSMIKQITANTDYSEDAVFSEYKQFKESFPTGKISKDGFASFAQAILPSDRSSDEFVERIFNAFDGDRSGEIDFGEFMLAMSMCSSDDPIKKVEFCFRSLDIDGSGALEENEVSYAVEILFDHNPGIEDKLPEELNSVKKVVKQIFKIVDTDNSGSLQLEELTTLLQEDPNTFSYLGLNLIFLT